MFSEANKPRAWVAAAGQRLAQWRRSASDVAAEVRHLQVERDTTLQRVGLSKARAELREDVAGVIEAVRDRVHARTVGMYEELLSTFMRETLPDQSDGRRLVVELSTKRGQSSIGFFVQRQNGQTESVFDGNGGAVTNVVSTALRMIALRKAAGTLRQFLVLDEPDCWIAPDRIPDFYRVIAEASASLNIQLLVITHHDPEILAALDAHFVRLLPGQHGVVVDHDPVDWHAGDSGIRSLRLLNYRSHSDSFIPLSPNMTVLSGANNLGKSAVIDALRAVSYGEGVDDAIQHEQENATVEIDLGDKVLTWTRNRKGNPKETYRLSSADVELRSEDRSRGSVPEWVGQKDLLGIALVDGLDVQIGHQKRPTFLLDEPASKQAAILSVGQEAAWVDRLLTAHKSIVTEDQSTIRKGEARLTQLQGVLSKIAEASVLRQQIVEFDQRYDSLAESMAASDALAQITQEMRALALQIQAPLPSTLPATPQMSDTAALNDQVRQINSARRLADQLSACVPTGDAPKRPDLQDAATLRDLLIRLHRATPLLALACPVTPPLAPDMLSTQDLGDLLRRLRQLAPLMAAATPHAVAEVPRTVEIADLAQLCRAMAAQQAALTRIEHLPARAEVSPPDLHDLTALRLSVSEIGQAAHNGKEIAALLKKAVQEHEAAQSLLEQVRKEAGDVCPLCHNPLSTHDHATH